MVIEFLVLVVIWHTNSIFVLYAFMYSVVFHNSSVFPFLTIVLPLSSATITYNFHSRMWMHWNSCFGSVETTVPATSFLLSFLSYIFPQFRFFFLYFLKKRRKILTDFPHLTNQCLPHSLDFSEGQLVNRSLVRKSSPDIYPNISHLIKYVRLF